MNPKLKTALIRRSSEQGFAIPTAIGLGLVMLLVGATMIVRSQGDQVAASTQKATASSLQVAEAGVTKVQRFLDKYRILVTQPHKPSDNIYWKSYWTSLANGCPATSPVLAETTAFDSWINIGSGTNPDRFRVISYTPPATASGDGTLVVEAELRDNNTTARAIAKSRLKVIIPVERRIKPTYNPPGAWATDFGLGNNKIVSDTVIDSSCSGSLNATELTQITATATGGTPKIINDAAIGMGSPPAVPTSPAPITLPAITSDLTLPRLTGTTLDTPNAEGVYVYFVQKNGSGQSIDLSGNNKLVIQPGKKVTLYLEGNLNTQGGGTKIGHNCFDTNNPPDGEPDGGTTAVSGCVPTNFQIFGGAATTKIALGGSNTIDAFIYAPNAVNSGVNGAAQVRGSVWVKQWDLANGNHTVIVQTATWDNLPTFLLPPTLAPLTSWQRQEVQ